MKTGERQTEATLEKYLEKYAGGVPYSLLVAVFATAAAFMLPFAQPDITKEWPFFHQWPGLHALNPKVIAFWCGLLGWVPLYSIREYVKGTQVKRLHKSTADTKVGVDRLSESAVNIRTAMETLPPVTFVGDYAEIVRQSHLALGAILPRQANPDPSIRANHDDLTKTIKGILENLGTLAWTYDSRDIIYGVNVMLFVAHDDPDFGALDKNKISRFLSPGFNHDDLKGILRLEPELSVTINQRTAAPVPAPADSPAPLPTVAPTSVDATKVYDVIFGIPRDDFTKDHKGRWRVLPGSPRAYVEWDPRQPSDLRKAVRYVHDFQNLRNRETHRHADFDLDPDVLDALEEVYGAKGPGKMVRSFLAFPLVNENNKAVGTLNIHCNEPGILGDTHEGRISNFAGVVSPLVNEVATIVTAWMAK